ncbi:MAG: hypothetical protein ACJ75H_20090 [Thermoanaerobaculia bacterium]
MAVLPKNENLEEMSPAELRSQIVQEAEDARRRFPVPPMEEVLAEMDRIRESLPKDLKLPDSTVLLREDRER